MEQPTNRHSRRSLSTTVIALLCLQITIVIFIYPVIIGIIVTSFQNGMANLELRVDLMNARHRDTGVHPPGELVTASEPRRCLCPQRVDWRMDRLNDDDNYQNSAEDDAEDGTYLRCCATTDENALKKEILDVMERERKRNNRDGRQGGSALTIADVETLVITLLDRNNAQVSQTRGPDLNIQIAVHVTGRTDEGYFSNMSSVPPHKRRMYKVGPWELDKGRTFSKHVDVDTHCIIVPASGIYNVYSQSYFRDERDIEDITDSSMNEYLHMTVLESTAYTADPVDLMKSGRTQQGISGFGYYYSSYHSGLFILRRGDRIYMKVHLPNPYLKLDNSQDATFMGLFMISRLDE